MRNTRFTKNQITEKASFNIRDRHRIRQCRGTHNRLGFAYQMAFVRLTGRFPSQDPFEIIEEIVSFVGNELDLDPKKITGYSERQPTVSAHQQQIRLYLELKKFDETENECLKRFLFEEACRLEKPSPLLAIAKEFLQNRKVLLPADATLNRIIGEQRDLARQEIFGRVMDMLNPETRERFDQLLAVENSQSSTFQFIKQPPEFPSPRALLRLMVKLERIQETGVLNIDLSWINNNFQKSLAKRARNSSVWRMRVLHPPHRYTVLACFLWQTFRDTIDYIIDMHSKLITRMWRRAENELDKQVKKRRKSLRSTLSFFKKISHVLLDEELPDDDIRSTVFEVIPPEKLREQMIEAEDWLSGKKSDPFALVVNRFSYLRQFSPSFLEHLSFKLEPEGNDSIIKAIEILRKANYNKTRRIPKQAPVDFIPQRLRPFIENNGRINRRAYECAVFSSLRDEIKRGNIWIKHSKRYSRLDDFFISNAQWESIREDFFRRAELPSNPTDIRLYLTERLNRAFDRFLHTFPKNAYVMMQEDGWRLGKDQAETLDLESESKLGELKKWLGEQIESIRLPDLLINVDNDLQYSRHFLSPARRGERQPQDICSIIATIMAYGCNIGPQTMARLTDGITYDEIKRIADWRLHEETLRRALVDVVNAIIALETTRVWGKGKTSSSDGQRFLFPKKVLKRTWSHQISNFAVEFYSFIADNYAPFYSIPIECTDRDAPFVLDGLLYHETDLEIEEHYVDTHGYTELNFAAFAMLGKRFCPRIRGLHHQWVYRIDKNKSHGPLDPIVARGNRTIHLDWICDQWDRMGQFYASLQRGHTTASIALKRLISFGPKNKFYRANRELGRIFKTEFILQYLSDSALRRRVQRGLLKGEQLHALARNVHYGRLGKHHARDFQQQMSSASCLVLILACIVYWQAKTIGQILFENDPEQYGIDASLLSHISPIEWDNIVLYGQYKLDRNLIK
jgi:TnpA family transposase